jgi:hypothetical protein
MGCGPELALEIGNLALEGGMLLRILFRKMVQVLTQFLVLPEQNEGDEGGGDRQNGEKHQNQLGKGHGSSLGCMIFGVHDLCSDVRTEASKNLAICFPGDASSNLFRHKGSKMKDLASRFGPAGTAKQGENKDRPNNQLPTQVNQGVVYFLCA